MEKHKVFISYYHSDDQNYKEELLKLNDRCDIFIDGSVGIGDIDDSNMNDDEIRVKIRDEYLKDTSVTIILIGKETKKRKHIDWEIYSSMRDGKINKKSGILVIQLPTINPIYYTAAHEEEKSEIYSFNTSWTIITSRDEYNRRYPYLSERVIDNLLCDNVKISVARWNDLDLAGDGAKLKLLIDLAFNAKLSNEYDLSREMKRRDS